MKESGKKYSHGPLTGISIAATHIEEQLRAIWNAAPNGMALSDEKGIVVDINPVYCRIYGYDRNEVIGKEFSLIFPQDKRKEAMNEYKKLFAFAGPIQPVESIIRKKNGETRIVESRYSFIIHNGKRRYILSIVHDITDQKAHEQKHAQEERRFRELIEHNSDAIAQVGSDGTIQYISTSVQNILGYTAEELVGRKSSDLFVPGELERSREKFQQIIARPDTPVTVQHKAIHKDGSVRWIESITSNHLHNPDINGFISNFRDITQRKQAEESQARLAAIVATSDDAIISKTLDGIITSWNRSAEKIFGYTADEAIGKHITLIIPQELHYEEAIIIGKLRRGEHIDHFETIRVTKFGERKNISLSISPIKNEEGQVIGASKIARDITERKKYEERQQFLSSIRERLAVSLDHTITLQEIANLLIPYLADYCRIALVDDNKGITEIVSQHEDPDKVSITKDLYTTYAYDASSTHGIPHIIATGKPEMISRIDDTVLKTLKTKKKVKDITKRIGLQSYLGVPLIARGKVIGALTLSSIQPGRQYTEDDLAFAQEVAARIALTIDNLHLYKKVNESERLYRLVVENTNDLITLLAPNGSVLYISPSWTHLLGYAAQDIQGKNVFEILVHPEDLQKAQEHIKKTLNGTISVSPPIRIRHKNGSWIILESTASAIHDNSGQPYMIVATSHDITGRIELERRKDDFISMASHELKTPVTSMSIFLQLLEKNGIKNKDTYAIDVIAKMHKQMRRMTKLISDLLDLSKIQAGRLEFQKEQFVLRDLIVEVVETLRPTTNHRLLIKELAENNVFADKDRIGQVLINLITNAIKYSPEINDIVISSKVEGDIVTVSIQDFGIGISEKDQGKIFERFFRSEGISEKTYPGFGIGLYITQEIIRKHHGEVWVKSKKGKGSTFSFSLPVVNKK